MAAKKKKRKPKRSKPCPICRMGLEYVDYKDTALLKSFITERGKIKARRTTGNCARHQKMVDHAVKNAREMALIPYVAR